MRPGGFSNTPKAGRTLSTQARVSGQSQRSSAAPRRCPAHEAGWQGGPAVRRVTERGSVTRRQVEPPLPDSFRVCPPVAPALASSAFVRLAMLAVSATSASPFPGSDCRLVRACRLSLLCRRRSAASAKACAVTFRTSPKLGTPGHHCLRILQQYGSISANPMVLNPARPAAMVNPPMPEKRSRWVPIGSLGAWVFGCFDRVTVSTPGYKPPATTHFPPA